MISTEPEGALGSCAVARGRRYAERTKLPRLASLGNEFLPNSHGLISVGLELLVQTIEMHIKVLLELCQSDSVDTTSTLVPLHSIPGQFQVLPLVNLVHQRVDQIVFDNTQTYNIAGVASVSLESNTLPSLALVTVMQGNHQFQVTTNLLSDSTVDVAAESTLSFHNMLNLMGHTLVKTGAGTMYINNVLHTGDGTIDVQQGTVSGVGTLGGDVINDSGIISPGHGERITVVPEPMGVVLIVMGLLVLSFQRWFRE